MIRLMIHSLFTLLTHFEIILRFCIFCDDLCRAGRSLTVEAEVGRGRVVGEATACHGLPARPASRPPGSHRIPAIPTFSMALGCWTSLDYGAKKPAAIAAISEANHFYHFYHFYLPSIFSNHNFTSTSVHLHVAPTIPGQCVRELEGGGIMVTNRGV